MVKGIPHRSNYRYMKFIKSCFIITSIIFSLQGYSQGKLNFNNEKEPDDLIPQPFAKKFHWGISANTYFTTFVGDNLARTYFSKPSLGFNVRAEYFFNSFVGVGVGAGFQQRGTGIINQDHVGTLGNLDSTYLERMRFNTIEVPVSVILRTSKDVIKGIRLSGTVSLLPLINFESNDVFSSPPDGVHVVTPQNDQYQKSDLMYQFSFGPDINAGNTGIFRVHFVYSHGTNNVYTTNQYQGYNQGIGIQLSWLF